MGLQNVYGFIYNFNLVLCLSLLPHFYVKDPAQYETLDLGMSNKTLTIEIIDNGTSSVCSQTFVEQKAYSLILYPAASKIECKLVSQLLKLYFQKNVQ